MTDQTPIPTAGNQPTLPDAAIWGEYLRETHADALKRATALLSSLDALPPVADAETAATCTDAAAQFLAVRKEFEALHAAEKKGPLALGRVVDDLLGSRVKELDAANKRVAGAVARWKLAEQERQDRERREAEAAAREAERIAREEAEAARLLAETPEEKAAIAEAEQKVEEAAAAVRQIETPAPVTMARGNYGTGVVIKQPWIPGKIDRDTVDLNKLRPYLDMAAIEKAARAYIKGFGKADPDPVTGITFERDVRASSRG